MVCVCVCVCLCVCVYVSVFVCLCVHVCACTRACVNQFSSLYMYDCKAIQVSSRTVQSYLTIFVGWNYSLIDNFAISHSFNRRIGCKRHIALSFLFSLYLPRKGQFFQRQIIFSCVDFIIKWFFCWKKMIDFLFSPLTFHDLQSDCKPITVLYFEGLNHRCSAISSADVDGDVQS